MNTRLKLIGGVMAGLVAGATLVGTAFAAPRLVTAATGGAYAMMRPYAASATFEVPTIPEMNTFMNRYRTPSGAIDFNRMHADVTSGKVTPPCVNGAAGTGRVPRSGSGGTSSLPGYGMMNSTY